MYPSTQWNITQVASGFTFAVSASSLIETPSHWGRSMDHLVTQCADLISVAIGSLLNSS